MTSKIACSSHLSRDDAILSVKCVTISRRYKHHNIPVSGVVFLDITYRRLKNCGSSAESFEYSSAHLAVMWSTWKHDCVE